MYARRTTQAAACLTFALALASGGSGFAQDAAHEPDASAPPAFVVVMPDEAPAPVIATETLTPEAAPVVAAVPEVSAAEVAPVQQAETPVVVPLPPEVTVDLAAPVPSNPVQADAKVAAVPLAPVPAALKAALAIYVAADVPRTSAGQALRRQREAVAAAYEARSFAPLWLDGEAWNGAAKSAIARLERAGDDALDLRATPIPALGSQDPQGLAASELGLSEAVVSYAREASGGRIDPRSISSQITSYPEVVGPARSLAEVSASADAGAVLAAYNPGHHGYVALRDKLAELRREKPAVANSRIPLGPDLKVGMKDMRVPLIRARFGLDQAVEVTQSGDLVYDTRVAEAVAGFQKAQGLPASGMLTARTIAALSGGQPNRLEDEIIANMERWRWMPRDMGEDRIEVNIPDYTVRVYHGDTVVHSARVVVGKPNTPTPVFSDTMRFLIVNPYWNVPPSIIKKEMMPRLAKDPTYLQRLGYEVIYRKGQMIVRQPPGERNALGWIKFMFPNDHSVYLHDTPSRALFNTTRRAFSHGCVRVDQPFALAEIVLGQGWTEAKVKSLKGGGERTVKMPKPLPIHIGYFSAFVEENGKLQLREDIYGYSHKVKSSLGLAG
ncbi:MAG: ErfK/YbiS/YcfS/YnhG family protein [Hyphomicrobiales bacterium]|nr:ErfK/YbiS/YcfS/YnhG family protein [Hyphomicrobiales bacterium]